MSILRLCLYLCSPCRAKNAKEAKKRPVCSHFPKGFFCEGGRPMTGNDGKPTPGPSQNGRGEYFYGTFTQGSSFVATIGLSDAIPLGLFGINRAAGSPYTALYHLLVERFFWGN